MTITGDLESRLTAGNTTIPTHHADAARRLCTRRGEPAWITAMLGLDNTNNKQTTNPITKTKQKQQSH